MGKVNIIYWSGTGNTEAMAGFIEEGAKGAGAEVSLITADAASVDDINNAKAIALGCPSMGAEQLEESTMEPFMCDIEGALSGKQVVLFGSYGWGNQEWMRDWEERVKGAGATVVNDEGITVNGAPDDDVANQCRQAGQSLAALA